MEILLEAFKYNQDLGKNEQSLNLYYGVSRKRLIVDSIWIYDPNCHRHSTILISLHFRLFSRNSSKILRWTLYFQLRSRSVGQKQSCVLDILFENLSNASELL